jgi:hypothetical protein
VCRQDADVRLFLTDESLLLQPALDYAQVTGLSSEECERLARTRPLSIVSFDHIYALILVKPAAGRRKTNGRDDTEGHRRITTVCKENICGAIGGCQFGLNARPAGPEGNEPTGVSEWGLFWQ